MKLNSVILDKPVIPAQAGNYPSKYIDIMPSWMERRLHKVNEHAEVWQRL